MIEQLRQHVSESTCRRLRGGKKQHAHEIGDVDVGEGNSVFVEVEQKSDEIVSLYGIGPAFLHNGQNMLEEMLPRLHRLLLRSEEHTSELQSLMRISYAVFCLKQKQPTHYYRYL